jgi:hypothetical protein
MAEILPFRKYDEHGTLAIRDGFVFCLFMRADHHELAESVGRLFDCYLQIIGPDTLRWITDRGGAFQPFTKRRQTSLRKRLSSEHATPGKKYMVKVKGEEEVKTAPGHLFFYSGSDRESLLRIDHWGPTYTSAIEIWFPTDFAEDRGWETFVRELLELASFVPFASGYCSLALNFPEWARIAAESLARGLVKRYPGLDVHDNVITSLRIGNQVRGAYWLTLLGTKTLENLDLDASGLREALGPEIVVHEIGQRVAIQAGVQPELGDTNRGDNLTLVRRVARVVEPVQLIQTSGILIYEEVEDFVDWQKRHIL